MMMERTEDNIWRDLAIAQSVKPEFIVGAKSEKEVDNECHGEEE